MVGVGLPGLVTTGLGGALASAAGAAKALPARRIATARRLVNCILVGLMVLIEEGEG